MSGIVLPWRESLINRSSEERSRIVSCIDNQNKSHTPHSLELCGYLIEIFAAIFGVSTKALRQRARSVGEVNRVRQIAMYVAHVVCQLSMSSVGEGFGRDRTTVLHACHLVEDMRDDEEFDQIVAMAERVAMATIRNRLEV